VSVGKNWHIPAILHDWATGKTSTDIAKIYGFSSANACLDRISKWRKAGWPFPKKTEDKELTDSEATTAGTIRGSENDG
jgi:hypothetical protein